jgi:hypothetical protein
VYASTFRVSVHLTLTNQMGLINSLININILSDFVHESGVKLHPAHDGAGNFTFESIAIAQSSIICGNVAVFAQLALFESVDDLCDKFPTGFVHESGVKLRPAHDDTRNFTFETIVIAQSSNMFTKMLVFCQKIFCTFKRCTN